MARKNSSLLWSLVVCLLILSGCGGNNDAPSITEEARRNADPRAVSFLLEAQEAFENEYFNPALVLTDSAARYAPELADIPFLRGRILTKMHQYGPAQEAYEEALALDPEYPGVYFNLGNSAYLRGAPQEALDLYLQEKGAANTTQYLTQLGRVYADLGKPDSARWAYEQAILADSTDPVAYMWLGQSYEDEGDFETALQYSHKGLALRPGNPNYAYVVGVQLLRSEDFEGAVAMLSKVAEAMPWHYSAHYNLAQAYAGLGDSARSAHYLALSDTLLEGRRETTKWEDLLRSNSHEPMLWINYGMALHEAGRTEDAIEALNVAYSLRPEWLELQNNIANLHLALGDTTAALARYHALLEVDDTQPDVWLNLGTVYALSGAYDDARAAWETALKHDPNHPEAARYIAQLPK